MASRHSQLIAVFFLAVLLVLGCKRGTTTNNSNSGPTTPTTETGVEKVKPNPGTGNVQGKVFFNSKPVENINVKLCEKFSRFVSGCGGQTYTAKTDKDGDFVITDVKPGTYEALMAQVFDTNMYVFAVTGLAGISAAKYEVTADKTLFARATDLYKSDLKTTSPKAAQKVSGQNLELKWDAYPDAAYYKFSLFADNAKVTSPYINTRTDDAGMVLDKPLPKGTYRYSVEAYNSNDKKLAENSKDIKFTVTDGPEPPQ
jgi:hypothetical protein